MRRARILLDDRNPMWRKESAWEEMHVVEHEIRESQDRKGNHTALFITVPQESGTMSSA